MKLDDWLHNNTFHHAQYWDMLNLVKEKEKQGVTISLCIPTLNEEKTIGKEIIIFKSELMTRYPFLDEIAVIIDAATEDRTAEVAASFGADVYFAKEILPEMGIKKGKGENLWKAIYQLKGDIIVYIDADIKNVHPRFIYGLVAPLIYRPDIKYVKAFYERPLASSQEIRPSGGGRVTEILIRPLFSLFFPELTGMIQPLSGEYAVRREVLERIPFPIGYGVETSHLIDVYHKWGLDAFGQTDLDQRIHRNQSIQALSRMSFGILHTFFFRIQSLGIVQQLPDLLKTLHQFQIRDTAHERVDFTIEYEERPPMIDVPAYREKFDLDNNKE